MSSTTDFVTAIIAGLQDVEDTLVTMLNDTVETAIGAQLDQIGKLVGQKRAGLIDEVYRRYIRARIAANRSSGMADELIAIVRLVLGPDFAAPTARVVLKNQGHATLTILIEIAVITDDLADVILVFLRTAAASGVRVILDYTTGTYDDVMLWGTGTWGQNWLRSRT